MRHLIATLSLSALLTSGCDGSGESGPDPLGREPQLGQEFVLGYGDSVHVGELRLTFSSVSEESRCPVNGTCPWEGNARILMSAMRDNNFALLELNTHPDQQTAALFAGYVIELRDLRPHPFAPLQIHLATYKATLVVDGPVIPAI